MNWYKKYLWFSVGGHVALALALLGLHKAGPGGFRKTAVIAPSLKVRMTALPEKAAPKIKRRAEKPAPLPLKKPAVKKDKQAKKNKQAEKDKSKQPTQKAKTAPAKKTEETPPEKTAPKGNRPSPGQSEGEQNARQIIINDYLIEIIDRIKGNWNLPKYLTDHSFRAELEIKINALGQVTEKKIITPSGNEAFDGKALRAVERSAPFPPPPESVRDLIEDGIVFQLNSREETGG